MLDSVGRWGWGDNGRGLTSLQQLQVRGERCVGICQRGEADVPEMEDGGEQREHGVDLLAVGEEEEEEEEEESWQTQE